MITGEDQLRQLYAMPAERALRKQQAALDAHCQRFIALSPLCVLATGGGAGALMDASPRGGALVHAAGQGLQQLPSIVKIALPQQSRAFTGQAVGGVGRRLVIDPHDAPGRRHP